MIVSVIIPVYNVSMYIGRCLDSVIHQRITDFECIIIDDCSDDDSMEQVTHRLSTYEGSVRFRIIPHTQNRGLSAARNTGIQASAGDYVFFLDGDDEMTDDCLEVLTGIAESYPDVDIVQGSSIVYRPRRSDNIYQLNNKLPAFSADKTWLAKSMLERQIIPVTSWNKLINRDFLLKNGLFFREGIIHEDEHWTFFAARHIRSMAFCTKVTYKHYIREDSIMTSSADRSIFCWFSIIDDFINNLDNKLLQTQSKVILEVSFCNLIRIVKQASPSNKADMLETQRLLLEPCLVDARKRKAKAACFLLSWFSLPLSALKILCVKDIRGIYFKTLKYLV